MSKTWKILIGLSSAYMCPFGSDSVILFSQGKAELEFEPSPLQFLKCTLIYAMCCSHLATKILAKTTERVKS